MHGYVTIVKSTNVLLEPFDLDFVSEGSRKPLREEEKEGKIARSKSALKENQASP